MGRRPGHCYRLQDRPPFVRKKYIHRQPPMRITSFDMGNTKGDFEIKISLVALQTCQIRHHSLEAARVAANRWLLRNVTRPKYHLRVRIKPFHFLRENKMISGAGADRVQDGMRKAFGKVIGRAARVDRHQAILTVRCNRESLKDARKALKKASYKLPTSCRIEFDEIDPELRRKLGYGTY
ncbi:MAG: 50S ribosomal protein L16 [Candidatus Lokiarchaeota archaeon]|nr:50S ribosomal protein L16 [Candidatus Lokiarchaeota archaeon]